MSNTDGSRNAAYQRFECVRRQARIEQFSNHLTGRSTQMIPFERIRTQLKQQNTWYQGVQDIPVNMPTIEAHVWAFPVEIEVNAEDTLDDLLIRFGEQAFLEITELDKRHPNHQIWFTSPGRYTELLAQIEDLWEKLAMIDGVKMAYYDAVDAWYEMFYLPTIQIIQDSTLMIEFPRRTQSDLFVWMSGHREGLREKYGDYENLADLASMLAYKYKEGRVHKLTRHVRRLFDNHSLPPLAEF